jgi:hypothetical protein
MKLNEVFITEADREPKAATEKFRELLLVSFPNGEITNVQAQKLYLQAQKELGIPQYKAEPGKSNNLSSFAQHALATIGAERMHTPTKSNPKAVTWKFDPAKVKVIVRKGRPSKISANDRLKGKEKLKAVAKEYVELQKKLGTIEPISKFNFDPWEQHDEEQSGTWAHREKQQELYDQLRDLTREFGIQTVKSALKDAGLQNVVSRQPGRYGAINVHSPDARPLKVDKETGKALNGLLDYSQDRGYLISDNEDDNNFWRRLRNWAWDAVNKKHYGQINLEKDQRKKVLDLIDRVEDELGLDVGSSETVKLRAALQKESALRKFFITEAANKSFTEHDSFVLVRIEDYAGDYAEDAPDYDPWSEDAKDSELEAFQKACDKLRRSRSFSSLKEDERKIIANWFDAAITSPARDAGMNLEPDEAEFAEKLGVDSHLG